MPKLRQQDIVQNTNLTITQNDSVATALIGDGSPGGNNVTIKQNLGVVRK